MAVLAECCVLVSLVLVWGASGQDDTDQNSPERPNLIPSIPMPSWVDPDLTSFPSNLPGAPQWQFPQSPQGGGGGAGGALSALAGLAGGGGGAGGAGGAGGLLSALAGGAGGGGGAAGGLSSVLPLLGSIMAGAPPIPMYPMGDPRNCLRGNPKLNILHVVPGVGWDNLRNTETGLLTSFSYSKCRVTFDRNYLIPDETFAIPIKTSLIERQAELFDSWDTYKSVTSRSINSEVDLFGKIGGKFSSEYQRIKSKQYTEKSVTMRVELRHRFYTIKQLPDAPLHPGFKHRLLEVLSLIKSNDSESAEYAAQMIVRDYGTHCLTSLDAGAVLIKEDNLKSSIMVDYQGRADSLSTAAGVDLYDLLKVKASVGFSNYNGQSDLDAYRSKRTSSRLYTYGGPPYRLGMNLSDWENNLMNNLVASDRSGRPIHALITTQAMLPQVIEPADVYQLKKMVQDAISQYYDYNTHVGCTNPKAPNFDYQANDGTPELCKESSSNYTFGGVFQKCTGNAHSVCKNLVQKNPLTGGYTCPKGFQALLVQYGLEQRNKMRRVCHKKKKCTFFVFNCHNVDVCTSIPYLEVAKIESFWCAPTKKNRPNFGYMFGGLYSNDIQNPITRARSCPTHFIPLRLGSHAKVCVSEDYELGHQFSLPFGGFFSCISGNVLAGNGSAEFLNNPKDWPMRCPGGFTQHLALTEKSCRINYCVKAGALLRAADLELVLPPFDPKPLLRPFSTANLYTLNVTGRSMPIRAGPLPPVASSVQSTPAAAEGNGAGHLQPVITMVIAAAVTSVFQLLF